MSKLALDPINVPALASAPTIPTLRAGDCYYNTATSTFYTYSGSAWIAAGGASLADIQDLTVEVLMGVFV